MRTLTFVAEGAGDASAPNQAKILTARPAPGHQWLTTSAYDLRSEWKEGTPHPTYENVVASHANGMWRPAPGYNWRIPDNNDDYSVSWAPGLRHRDFTGVKAAEKEGMWTLASGYTWLTPSNDDLRTRWAPGVADKIHRHVVASIPEGLWHPASGYEWSSKAIDDYEVKWKPGLPHPVFENVISSATEGKWHPAQGYTWKNTVDEDLNVEFSEQAQIAFQNLTSLSQRVLSDMFRQTLCGIITEVKIQIPKPCAQMRIKDLVVNIAISCLFTAECRQAVPRYIEKADDWFERQFRAFQPHPALDDVRDAGERAVREAFGYDGELEKPMITDAPDRSIERAGSIA